MSISDLATMSEYYENDLNLETNFVVLPHPQIVKYQWSNKILSFVRTWQSQTVISLKDNCYLTMRKGVCHKCLFFSNFIGTYGQEKGGCIQRF